MSVFVRRCSAALTSPLPLPAIGLVPRGVQLRRRLLFVCFLYPNSPACFLPFCY